MKLALALLSREEYKYLSISRMADCFVEGKTKLHDINNRYRQSFPEFRSKFIEEWHSWMKDINEKRDDIIHFFVVKEGLFDARLFRDQEKDIVHLKFITEEIEDPYDFVLSISKRFNRYVIWIIKYVCQHYNRDRLSGL